MISNDSNVYIIAEIGVNHNGNYELAIESIKAAKEAGADAVKFQSFKTEKLVSKKAKKANYQIINTGNDSSQFEMLKKLQLSYNDVIKLKQFCDELKIDFISSPFDRESAQELFELGLPILKLGSGEITNLPLLKYIDSFKKTVLLSTGMSNLSEIEEALTCFEKSEVILLHCTSNYPTPYKDINLRAMKKLGDTFNKVYGYSDHSEGFEVAVGAVALGAKVIEKHYTLDKNLEGPDHKASLNPIEFKNFVKSIRNIEEALGDGIKRCMPSELNTRDVARKSIIVSRNITKGEIFSLDNLTIKRPGTGIHPRYLELLVGKMTKRDFAEDSVLNWEDLL